MSNRFKIHKSDDESGHWCMDYPRGFAEPGGPIGEVCPSFSAAVAAFVSAAELQCPQCLRGAVIDTALGWRCENCGTYDIAKEIHPDSGNRGVLSEVAKPASHRVYTIAVSHA